MIAVLVLAGNDLTTAEKIEQLFTWASLGTLQGAVAATFIVTNVLGSLIGQPFDKVRKFVAFGFAVGLELALASSAAGPDSLEKWFVAVLNGFLVYASAVGINQGAASFRDWLSGATQPGLFFRRWF